MATALVRNSKFAAVTFFGVAVAISFSLRPNRPFANAAQPPTTQPANELIDASDTLDLTGLQAKFQSVASRVSPSVVSISAAESASDSDSTVRADEMNPDRLQQILDKSTRTIGTGFIVDPDGYILTNEHVIEESQQYWITTDDHRVFPAIVVASDPRADLAILKIPADHLPTVRFASTPSQRGQWAITLGNPYGLATEGDMALSVGVVSATDRSLPKLASKEDRLYSNLIQTTAQINPGNSGGPLFDVDGNVIGIDTAVILPQKQTNGIGFAIPITPELLNEVVMLRQGSEVVYGYIGVTVSLPTPRARLDAGLAASVGVCVNSVEDHSPASAPDGLKDGDIIVQVNGVPVSDTDRFVRLVGAAPVDRNAVFNIVRNGKPLAVNIKPIKRPVQYAISNQNQRFYWRGMVLGPTPSNWPSTARNEKHFAGVQVVGIQDDCPLKKRGLVVGAVITSIAGQPIKSILELQRVLNDVPPEHCDVQLADQVLVAQK